MKAAVVSGPGRCEVGDVPDPRPGAGEVVVEVDRCGVCGTDLHVLDGEAPQVTYPVIPGHEFTGRVAALGAGVTTPAVGTFVAVDPMVFCGHCAQCRAGWTNLCLYGGGLGTTADGAFAELVVVKASQCEPVPPGVPVAWAPLTEPLSCALHAIDRVGPVAGERALVFGAGPVGLMLTRLLDLAGAEVDVVERRPDRLGVATVFGAARSVEDASQLDAGPGWGVVVDATGNPAAIAAGLSLVKRAGTFAVFGVAAADARVEFSPYEVLYKELTIIGSNSVRHSFGRAMGLMAAGRVPVGALLGPPVPLAEIASAFAQTRRGEGFKTIVSVQRG